MEKALSKGIYFWSRPFLEGLLYEKSLLAKRFRYGKGSL